MAAVMTAGGGQMSISDDGVWAIEALEVRRWKRYGHDRLYVAVPDGRQLGFRDLLTGRDHPESPQDSAALSSRADQWSAGLQEPSGPAPLGTAPVAATRAPSPTEPWRDLALNLPGQSAGREASAKRAEAPVRTTIDRLMGRHSDERAWRIGAKGERLVGEELLKLTRRDPRWAALHAIPVGRRGADIDHLLLGPGGVFALNTKHHPDARIRVSGSTFTVNGHRVPYVHRSEREAARATRLLSAAIERPVPVTGMIVPVGCHAPIAVTVQPRSVHVVTRRDLVRWMSALGQVWSVDDLHQIWEQARRSTTWTRD